MSNWIDNFKDQAISSNKRHIVIADTDNLFEYPELSQVFELENFTILKVKTDLEVRIQFELLVKDSDNKYLIVAPANYKPLPDIEMNVHFLSIGLPNLFPNLDAKAIKGLSFNALILLSNIKLYEELGHDMTIKFLLENLYNVDFESLNNSKSRERLLYVLINVLIEKNKINKPLNTYLSKISRPYLPELIEKGLSPKNLLAFIQKQWISFVEKDITLINFNEPNLSKSIGYLFVLGLLIPVKVSPAKYENFSKALKIGLYIDERGQNDNELRGLIEYLKQQLEIIEDIADQWFRIIQIFAKAKLKYFLTNNQSLKDEYNETEREFNNRFQLFIENTYSSQFTLSGVRKPIVVTRILEHLNASPEEKKALIVIDGMNYWQWKILSNALSKASINFSSGASLAFIPTITAWSRQAIFKGDKPDLSENNLKENKLFKEYWTKHNHSPYQIYYKKFSVSEPFKINNISDDITILGLVCNDLDNLMHGSIMGEDQLKSNTEQWIEKSQIVRTISELKVSGFQVYITSDHGNIEAKGLGNLTLSDKVGLKSRSKRHIYFTNETMLESFKDENKNLVYGNKDRSIYLKQKDAFTNENTQVITHGGSHFWEVIVPFISIDE